MTTLIWNDDLAIVAKAHVDDTGPLGLVGHTSSDGKSLKERLGFFGSASYYGENISYGVDNALEILI